VTWSSVFLVVVVFVGVDHLAGDVLDVLRTAFVLRPVAVSPDQSAAAASYHRRLQPAIPARCIRTRAIVRRSRENYSLSVSQNSLRHPRIAALTDYHPDRFLLSGSVLPFFRFFGAVR